MNLNFMDPNTDTSYGSIEELEQAIMAKKQPPSDTGGIMGLVMGGPPVTLVEKNLYLLHLVQ